MSRWWAQVGRNDPIMRVENPTHAVTPKIDHFGQIFLMFVKLSKTLLVTSRSHFEWGLGTVPLVVGALNGPILGEICWL